MAKEDWIAAVAYGALLLFASKKSDRKEVPKSAPQKSNRELKREQELEQQQRNEWDRRRAQAEQERQEHQDEIERQAEEAREDGYVVCTGCLPDRLTIICKACNSDGQEICVGCKQRQEDYDDEQRRIQDDD
jgi:multidrug efflux pump subunit AcrA (membrane-fusion protein)